METLQDGDELVFLYQLIPGHCDSSFACHIASLAGLPKEVVQRGAQVRLPHLPHTPLSVSRALSSQFSNCIPLFYT